MESPEAPVRSAPKAADAAEVSSSDIRAARRLAPQSGSAACSCGAPGGICTCVGNATADSPVTYPFVYALGRIQPRFPRLELEKEFAQATGRAETAGLTDRQAVHAVLSKRQNRYLARSLCWVLTVEGLETYILRPRDSADFDLLIEALRPTPSPADLDAIIGVRGPIAPFELCNGLMLPIVMWSAGHLRNPHAQ